jgi:ABC-2 type transport system permease protein
VSLFSPSRFWAIVVKEFVQMRRDRLTFGMVVGIPVLQLVLFGYAINADPRHLPTGVVLADHGPFGRTLLHAIRTSDYFDVRSVLATEREADDAVRRGALQFVIHIPKDFTRDLLRGDRPAVLLEADATDPGATGAAIGAARQVFETALERDLKGALADLKPGASAVDLRVHARYNPEAITQHNIVPGLMGVVLTMTMVMITGLAITRERERGTMENLLSMPTRPFEVMAGKILPFILMGYVQAALVYAAGRWLFDVPMKGDFAPLLLSALLFITANLAMGVTFSTIAANQLQAVQMSFFFFLPSLLLSGFMFPFRGMPAWAQALGEVFPLTHFLRIVRGIMLKGNGFTEIAQELWPIALFAAVVLTVGVKRYRRTLD